MAQNRQRKSGRKQRVASMRYVCALIKHSISTFSYLDVEGWHHRLKRKTGAKKGFYEIVVRVLFREVKGMENRLRMVSEKKLKRKQKSGDNLHIFF